MLPYIENAKTAMTIISEQVVAKLKKAQESTEPQDEMSVTDYKKCMDIVRDVMDSGIKLAKNEEVLEDQKETDCLIAERRTQEIYAMLQEFKTQFTPKVLRDIIEMGQEKAMEIITQVVEKVMQEQDCKIKRRDFKTKEEYKRAKYIQTLVVKRSQEEIEQSQREYEAWFNEMADPTPLEQRSFESLTEFSQNVLREKKQREEEWEAKKAAERAAKEKVQQANEKVEDAVEETVENIIDEDEIPSFYS